MIKEIIKIKPSKIKDIILDKGLKIIFESGEEVCLADYHDQCCCENVYADFDNINNYRSQLKNEYDEIVIEGVSDIGFMIGFKQHDYLSPLEDVLIPCYNEQNGYYDENLALEIEYPDHNKKTFDITNCKRNYYF